MTRSTISDSATIAIAPDVLASEVGPEVVMLSLRDGTYYGLDGVGAEIWRMLQTPVTIPRIVTALVEIYDVDADRCRSDVLTVMTTLVERGLVVIRDPT
jgi:hypothetical protein